MERKVIKTADGSSTIFLPELDEHYHSVHGAIQEALHVFIAMGLDYVREKGNKEEIRILEMGFGTGLNALLTLFEAQKHRQKIHYTGLEAFPVTPEELAALNYASFFPNKDVTEDFQRLHQVPWEKVVRISEYFSLRKKQLRFRDFNESNSFDLIYFDAFGPRVQPELWGEEIFTLMYEALGKGGVLVTYSAKGSVRRMMEQVGFSVERLPGPPGKREMLRAKKSG